MNELEKKVLKYLTENARYTVSELSAMLGETDDKIKDSIKNLEDGGTIVKYTAIVNPEKEDSDHVDALIEVKVRPQKLKGFDALAEELCAFKEVQSLYLMSGVFDLAVLIKGKNLTEIARFVSEKLSAVDGVISCATHFILKKYKIEGQTTKSDEEEKRQLVL